MVGTVMAIPEDLGHRIVLMPRRHHELLMGNISKIEFLEIGNVDAVIPSRAIAAPRHHVEASGGHDPFAHLGSPLFGDVLLNEYNYLAWNRFAGGQARTYR